VSGRGDPGPRLRAREAMPPLPPHDLASKPPALLTLAGAPRGFRVMRHARTACAQPHRSIRSGTGKRSSRTPAARQRPVEAGPSIVLGR
jgi:hypothetical protein